MDCESLDDAKEIAISEALKEFIREDIIIRDEKGHWVTEAIWNEWLETREYDADPVHPEYILVRMANGYFQVWEDELEEIENALREAYY